MKPSSSPSASSSSSPLSMPMGQDAGEVDGEECEPGREERQGAGEGGGASGRWGRRRRGRRRRRGAEGKYHAQCGARGPLPSPLSHLHQMPSPCLPFPAPPSHSCIGCNAPPGPTFPLHPLTLSALGSLAPLPPPSPAGRGGLAPAPSPGPPSPVRRLAAGGWLMEVGMTRAG